jgi:predicted permease
MSWITRIANALRPARTASDLDDELRFHLEQRIDELVRDGMSRGEAERVARLRFGGALQIREASRDVKSAAWLEPAVADFRFGVRVLRRHLAASLAAVASLAFAIGACTAAFSLLDALVFRPLPLPDPERLVRLVRVMPGFLNPRNTPIDSDGFAYANFEQFRDAARSSAELFAMGLSGGFQAAAFDDAGGVSENVRAESISGHGFEILGVKPAFGRLILPDDDSPAGGHPAAVLSYPFWKRRFGGSPSAIGRWVKLGGREFQIVGVAARGFSGVQPGYLTDLWTPFTVSADARALAAPDRGIAQVWGRLHPGAQPAALAASLQPALANFLRDRVYLHPPRNLSPAMVQQLIQTPLAARDASGGRDSLFRLRFKDPLRILALICMLLLLVACSNVGNLLIARASARQAEMALRVSLGASPGRLTQQMLIESAQLAAAAAVLAVLFASFAAPAIGARLGATEFPAWIDLTMDLRTCAFAVAVSLAAALLCGAAPALRASSTAPRAALQRAGRVRAMRWLVAAQVGFCVAVLFLSGLLLLSFRKLIATDLGFSRENIALFDLAPRTREGYRRNSGMDLLDAVRRLPGVRSASLSQQRPMGGDLAWIMTPVLRFPGGAAESVRPREVPVSAGFFEAMGIRRIAGRDFFREEGDRATESVIVNQAFVDQFLPGSDLIGRQFEKLTDDPDPVRQQIVGVVGNALWNNLREPDRPTIYSPLRDAAGATLSVRTASNPAPLLSWLRKEIETAAPSLTVRGNILLSTQLDNLMVSERLLATLAGFFSAAALLLASVGLYGVIHFAAAQRTREIGIRIALGAPRGSVARMMVADTSVPVIVGVAAGIGGGAALARYLSSQLFGVKPTDFWSLAAPVACILAAAAAAALPPAVRASEADPVTVLRQE